MEFRGNLFKLSHEWHHSSAVYFLCPCSNSSFERRVLLFTPGQTPKTKSKRRRFLFYLKRRRFLFYLKRRRFLFYLKRRRFTLTKALLFVFPFSFFDFVFLSSFSDFIFPSSFDQGNSHSFSAIRFVLFVFIFPSSSFLVFLFPPKSGSFWHSRRHGHRQRGSHHAHPSLDSRTVTVITASGNASIFSFSRLR